MCRLALSAVLIGAAVFVCAILGPVSARADGTTWRPGDAVRVVGWCVSPPAAAALAVAPDEAAVARLLRAGDCRALPPAVVRWLPPLRLVARLSRHADPMADGRPVSVWEAAAGERRIYIVLPDAGGPHAPALRREA